ncbi:MAG: shikimate dehydrogenase family protein [Acidimicrobiia bacterium]
MGGLRFVLLGDPVDHSLSPIMHRRALTDSGLDGAYQTIRADADRLQDEIEGLRRGETHGLNVTMPLKEEAARLCDRLTPEAEKSGSVNSLRLEDGLVVGHSTDVVAFRTVLARWAPRPLHLLGAGGSARAALAAVGEDTTVYVSSRRGEAAASLALRLESATHLTWGLATPGAVVVNATPLGMSGEPLPDGLIEVASGLIDLPYGKKTTPAVSAARDLGIPVVDGIEFLAIQAAAVFNWWTGESVDSIRLAKEATKI